MRAYIRELRRWDRDVKLFLLFQLLANVGFGVFNLIFNLYLYELDLREDFIGAVQAAQTICMAAAGVSLGILLNRIGTWRSIVGGAGLFLSMLLLLSFAEREALILVLAALSGIGLAYLFNTTMPFIMDWTRREQRQQVAAVAFSLQSLAITAGSLLGGFVPAILASFGSFEASSVEAFRWTMVLGAALGIGGIFPLFLMREARHGRSREEEAAARAEETPADRRQTRRDMTVFIASGGVMALGVGMVMPFYNVFLTTLGANSRQIGYVYALGGICAAVIGLSAPAVARRLGPLRAVFLVRSSIVPFYLLLIVAPGYGLAVLAHLARQTSISMAWPIDSTFIGELLPRRARLAVFGLRSAAWNLNWAVASLIGGAIIVRYGYDWSFASISFFTFLSAVIFLVYFGRHPKVRSGEIGAVPGRPVTVSSWIRRWPRRGNGVSSSSEAAAVEIAETRKQPRGA